jgi:hypothetical protein
MAARSAAQRLGREIGGGSGHGAGVALDETLTLR